MIRLNYELYIAPGGINGTGVYGQSDWDGNWDGLVGELVNRKADMAIGAISVMAERERVIDFTMPFYDSVGIKIIVKRVKAPTSLFKFLLVMEDKVWASLLGAYFITVLLIWSFDRCDTK